MEKNVAGTWIIYAFGDSVHANPGDPITGLTDITGNVFIDGVTNAIDDAAIAELDQGYYEVDLTAVETNGENLLLSMVSATANVTVVAIPAATWTRPPNLSDMGISATGIVDSNLEEINNVASPAVKLGASADTIALGTVSGTPTDIQFAASDLVSTENDNYNGKVLTWRSDTTTVALRGQAQFISSYDGTTKIITVGGPFTATPVVGDTFVIA